LASIAAPPNRAAAPTAAVFTGIARPDELLVPSLPAVADVAAGKVVVGVETPLVKGMPVVPLLALVKAGVALVSDGFGVPDVLSGFKTLFED
jgi:hypothetical protein